MKRSTAVVIGLATVVTAGLLWPQKLPWPNPKPRVSRLNAVNRVSSVSITLTGTHSTPAAILSHPPAIH